MASRRDAVCPRFIYCLGQHFQTCAQIGAIYSFAFNAITNGLIQQRSARELKPVRSRVGILVICHDNNQRQLFNRRLVNRFMESAGRGATIANAGRTHGIGNVFEPMG